MERHSHWCAICDARVVESDKPETGKWYVVHGHQWSAPGEWAGDYHGVLFAVCPLCDVHKYIDEQEMSDKKSTQEQLEAEIGLSNG